MPTYDETLRQRLLAFGNRVREERGRLGLAQEDLADAAGVHRTYVGSVERNISLGSIYAIADALGVGADVLIEPGWPGAPVTWMASTPTTA